MLAFPNTNPASFFFSHFSSVFIYLLLPYLFYALLGVDCSESLVVSFLFFSLIEFSIDKIDISDEILNGFLVICRVSVHGSPTNSFSSTPEVPWKSIVQRLFLSLPRGYLCFLYVGDPNHVSLFRLILQLEKSEVHKEWFSHHLPSCVNANCMVRRVRPHGPLYGSALCSPL